jgi:hypothetical protein
MHTNKTNRSSVIRSLRNAAASSAVNSPPFREGDIVEYIPGRHLASSGRRFIVAHCYSRVVDGQSRWIVAEVNADTHAAEDLRHVTPA